MALASMAAEKATDSHRWYAAGPRSSERPPSIPADDALRTAHAPPGALCLPAARAPRERRPDRLRGSRPRHDGARSSRSGSRFRRGPADPARRRGRTTGPSKSHPRIRRRPCRLLRWAAGHVPRIQPARALTCRAAWVPTAATRPRMAILGRGVRPARDFGALLLVVPTSPRRSTCASRSHATSARCSSSSLAGVSRPLAETPARRLRAGACDASAGTTANGAKQNCRSDSAFPLQAERAALART